MQTINSEDPIKHSNDGRDLEQARNALYLAGTWDGRCTVPGQYLGREMLYA